MWFLFRRKSTPPPPKASTGISAPASRMQQISMALARLERNRPLVWSLLSLMVLLALTNIYLFIHWWEKRHPKPPLGILRGELLKDFERYSPDDNHTEKVLEEVLGPDVEPTVKCVTPGCKWLNQQTSGNGHWRPAPCADFYGHVCNGRGALYYRASKKLMVAVVKHALSYSKRRHAREDSEASEHVRMLRHCVKGDLGASDFAFGCDFSKLGDSSSRPCPTDYPFIPHALSEQVFKEDSDVTAEEFVSRVKRSIRELGLPITLKHKNVETPKGITESRKEAICRWLADSARCHLNGKFPVTGDVVTHYQSLWNELYFAPLFETKDESVLWVLHGGGKNARKRACAHIHEGLFRAQSIEVATAVLDKMMGDVQEMIGKVLDTVQHMLSQRVSYWLSRHEEDELLRYQVKRRPAYLAELKAVDVELAGLSEPSPSDLGTSVFSWKTKYDRARNVLTVPHGLMATMVESDVEEPVLALPLSASLVRRLLPQPEGPYSWKDGHDQHLAYVTECFRSVHNATLDVDGNATLLKELIYESALLGPLFDVYRKAIFESFDAEVYLHDRYNNWQLFYVFWTMTHCGDPQRADLVNAVLRNSVRFTRSFDCGLRDAMYQRRKCNFWVYW